MISLYLQINTVRMVALATLHTCNQFALFPFSIAATAQAHVLLQGKLIFRRTKNDRRRMIVIFASLICAVSTLWIYKLKSQMKSQCIYKRKGLWPVDTISVEFDPHCPHFRIAPTPDIFVCKKSYRPRAMCMKMW